MNSKISDCVWTVLLQELFWAGGTCKTNLLHNLTTFETESCDRPGSVSLVCEGLCKYITEIIISNHGLIERVRKRSGSFPWRCYCIFVRVFKTNILCFFFTPFLDKIIGKSPRSFSDITCLLESNFAWRHFWGKSLHVSRKRRKAKIHSCDRSRSAQTGIKKEAQTLV